MATAKTRISQAAQGGQPAPRLFTYKDDAGNAERLVHHFGEDLRYCAEWGKWLVWDGGRWRVDLVEAHVQYALAVGDRLDEERELLTDRFAETESRAVAEEKAKGLLRVCRERVRKQAGNAAMLRLARSMGRVPIASAHLNRDDWVLNVRNGTLDLRTGELRAARRTDLITKQAPVDYDAEADCPRWMRFLRWATCGDVELQHYLQRLAGYALTGSTAEQKLPVFFGDGGNGKGVFLETLLAIMGDYAIAAAPFLLEEKKNADHPTSMADLFGVRLAILPEVSQGARFNEGLVKQLTGSDTVKARYMRQDFFSFQPTHTIIMAGNSKPRVVGQDHGIWRRLHLVPWEASLDEGEVDLHLREKLLDEAPGILRWAVEGCVAWQQEGLGAPAAILEATEGYRKEMDTVGTFVHECLIVAATEASSFTSVYARYADWCKATGHRPMNTNRLSRELTSRGFPSVKGAFGVRQKQGLRVPDGESQGWTEVGEPRGWH